MLGRTSRPSIRILSNVIDLTGARNEHRVAHFGAWPKLSSLRSFDRKRHHQRAGSIIR